MAQSATFSEKNFPILAALTAVSNITSTNPALHEDSVKNFAIFCYDYCEDLLAPITFAKKFGFLAGVVSKIFAIENALQSKNQFLRNAFGKSYLLRHLTKTIARKNVILEIGSTYYPNSMFLPRSTFYNFFSKSKQPQNLWCLFFFGQEISSGK